MTSQIAGRSCAIAAFALSTAISLAACDEATVVVPAEVAASSPATRAASPYLEDRVMVLPARGSAVWDIADAHGLRVVHAPGASGYAMLAVDSNGIKGSLHRLGLDPDVRTAYRVGAVYGTDDDMWEWEPPELPDPWHLTSIGRPEPAGELGDWVVAVLDTGVAYEFYASFETWEAFIQTPSLAGVTFVSPWDFVNDDAHANDDHQHGTLMASLIASQGIVEGVAPGVSLMPVKVLGADNSGNEVALIDGIYHAVDNGADVISMSLTFGQGYVPSLPLLEALQTAHDLGVVMVAAAGNDGDVYASWPAASPFVIAVAAGEPHPEYVDGSWTGAIAPTAYSNKHLIVDILSPGGNLDVDALGDGYVDGVLAESIFPGFPVLPGYWLTAGTSQATAITSGAVVHLLDAGAEGDQVVRAFHKGASSAGSRGTPFKNGFGAGSMDLTRSVDLFCSGNAAVVNDHGIHVAMLPHLQRNDDQVRPAVHLTVLTESGRSVAYASVYGVFSGSSRGLLECYTDATGSCTAVGVAVSARDASGEPAALAWTVSVDAVHKNGVAYRPASAVYATDALEVFLAAAAAEPALQDTVLAFYWEDTNDPVLGGIAESYVVINSGVGLASSPIGVIFTPRRIEGLFTSETLALDLDGTGLASSPIGLQWLRLVIIDAQGLASSPIGSGLASSPIGLRSLRLVVIEGTGLASSPIGLSARTLYVSDASTYDSAYVYFDSNPILLSTGTTVGVETSSTAVGDWVDGGGWVSSGYGGGSLMIGAGVVDAATNAAGQSGIGSVQVGN
ncbi:MAG: S8 family serine peptidase [Deltaproteobacteria bacterium]|nr:S8 family serine peptidase [Deltaproteobacteria bacterium]